MSVNVTIKGDIKKQHNKSMNVHVQKVNRVHQIVFFKQDDKYDIR